MCLFSFSKLVDLFLEKIYDPRFWMYFFLFLLVLIDGFNAASLPFALTQTFVSKIEFNEFIFDGLVNETPVQGCTMLRVSLATFC